MSECYIGEILLVPYSRGAPVGWLPCDGSSLSINEYDTLYSLLGTTFGGDGVSQFQLPDLRSRVPIHQGSGPGLQTYTLGQTGGVESVTLNYQNLPSHTHQMMASATPGNSTNPVGGGAVASMGPTGATTGATYTVTGGSQVALAGVGSFGNSQPHPNIQPSQGLLYIICTEGMYPPRS